MAQKQDYPEYLTRLPTNAIRDEKNRSVITLRLTQLLLQQDLTLSFFNFYSPSDQDGYLRVNASYKLSDALKITGGLNYFYGDKSHTFYYQFQNNSNVYSAVRYTF